MTDSLIPDWMKSIKKQQEDAANEEERDQLYVALSDSVGRSEGPKFWQQFMKELELQIQAANQMWKEYGLVANAMQTPETHSENKLRINITTMKPRQKAASCHVAYLPGEPFIKWYPAAGARQEFPFAVGSDGSFGVNSNESSHDITPEGMVNIILQPMIRDLLNMPPSVIPR
jgi:hypothetical protein